VRTKLSARLIEATKPAPKPFEVRDSEIKGLLLRVQPSGVRAFYLEYRRGLRAVLGKYPVMTVEAARSQALTKLAEFAQTGERAQARRSLKTLEDYVSGEYGPWVVSNRKTGRATLERIERSFRGLLSTALRDLSPLQIERWRTKRLDAGICAATLNRDLTALKAALSKAVEWSMLSSNPLGSVKPSHVDSHGRLRFLGRDEERRLRQVLVARDAVLRADRQSGNAWRRARGKELLPAIPSRGYADHLTPMTLLALNTGLRRGELTSLTREDIDLSKGTIRVRGETAKSGSTRYVPLNTEARSVLRIYLKQNPSDGRLFELERVNKGFAALLAKAQVPAFRFHDLRHTFASNLVMGGVDLNTVRELLGHADLKMTLRYAHLASGHKAAAVATLVRDRSARAVNRLKM
jgi:integrase